jgi:outer membrane protein assembly factor BamB
MTSLFRMISSVVVAFICLTCSLTVADSPLGSSGVQGGFVVHLGCGDGATTASLKTSDAYVVHGLDVDADKVISAREHFLTSDFQGSVSADIFDGRRLPYIDGMVNLLIVESPFDVTQDELMRVLAPGGVLLRRRAVGWGRTVKPIPATLDDWTHYLHEPDNNAVSRDAAITAPLTSLQWSDGPRYSRHHDKASSIPAVVSSGGRVFCIADEGPRASILWDSEWNLVARDAYNGVVLWRKDIEQWTDQLWPLKSGPSKTPRRLVAVGDNVYVTLGLMSPVSKLDAVTGETTHVYAGTERTEEILVKGDVLYLVVHPTIDPDQRGGQWSQVPKTVMAVRESDGTILWRHELPWIAPVTLTVDDQNAYICTGPKIIAFDRLSGDRIWKSEDLPWRDKMPTYFAPTLVVVGDNILYAGGENWFEHAGSRGLLTCLDAASGEIQWQQPHLPSGYQSPQDIFVIDGAVWCGSLNSKPGEFDTRYPEVSPSTGEFISYDLETGEPGRVIPRGADCYWFHHRCHRAKATEDYFLTSRTGIEMIDTESGEWSLHHWARGACAYGIMPANGLIYTPQHPCACYPEAKLSGFNALTGARNSGARTPRDEERVEKGPAFDSVQERENVAASPQEWPTFRGNPARSGATDFVVAGSPQNTQWQTQIGGKLSQPIAAGGRIFAAAIDAQTVYALNQTTGEIDWTFTAGGRVDSPPTYYKGTLLFGSCDGYVYCLRASDGVMVWRFQAAPRDERLMVYQQLESVWPVHGSILIRDDVAYFVAGRSMFLDGGLVLYRLNPTTGDMLSKVLMNEEDPNTGADLHEYVTGVNNQLSMPTASSDILSSEGDYLFMRSQPFDLEGGRDRVELLPLEEQRGEDAHLFVPNGFLDDDYWHRSFWVYGRSVLGGPRYGETGRSTPCGKLMVLDDENLYIFGRTQNYWGWTVPTEYRLFSVDRSLPESEPNMARPLRSAYSTRWEMNLPILARAMVKAGDTIYVCGPADIVDEQKVKTRSPDQLEQLRRQAALYAGADGSMIYGVSAEDGTQLFDEKLGFLPVFDGLIAADGNLYMSTVEGTVVCLGD